MLAQLLLTAGLLSALADRGIFPELSPRVALRPPVRVARGRAHLRADPAHGLLTLYEGDDPLRVYPARFSAHPGAATLGALQLTAEGGAARPAAEIATRVSPATQRELGSLLGPDAPVVWGRPSRAVDHDGDGIVDRLDILFGAKKLLLNRARYLERYRSLRYPGGDVPRTEGVCTDTVIRALRNAGIDLQKEVHEDLLRARHAYPMVEKVDASINHRRVKTLVPWFRRHWRTLPAGSTYRQGDVVFFDTFPARSGPEHLGVVGDRDGPSGLPLVINNWTVGSVDAEMDLLAAVPVTHHFRVR